MQPFEISQQSIAQRGKPPRVRVWRHSPQRHVREHATQQRKLTRTHLLVEQLRAVRVRNQRNHSLACMDCSNKRRGGIVTSLVEQVDGRQSTRFVFKLPRLLHQVERSEEHTSELQSNS